MSFAMLALTLGILSQPGEPGSTREPERLPTLDELLGLEGDGSPRGDLQGLPDPTQEDLQRQLTGAQAQEKFRDAVDKMGRSARRLTEGRDAGIATQRLQEDILRSLDEIIASQQGGSSSSQQQQQQQQQDQQQNAANQQQNQQSQNGDGNRTDEGPQRRDGELNPPLDSARAAWGSLPERLRNALVQGTNDPFSTMYRSLTEQYYRRLAEERP